MQVLVMTKHAFLTMVHVLQKKKNTSTTESNFLSYFAAQKKLAQHCKSTILQFKLKKKRKEIKIERNWEN